MKSGSNLSRAMVLFASSAVAVATFIVPAIATSSDHSKPERPIFKDITAESGLGEFAHAPNNDGTPFAFAQVIQALTGVRPTFGQSAYLGGVLIADFNNDGLNDVFATNAEGGANALFINRGNEDGTPQFTDIAEQAGVAFPEDQSSSAVAGDVNNDGYVDLYISVVHFDAEFEAQRSHPLFGLTAEGLAIGNTPGENHLNRLLLNRGTEEGHWLGFEDVTQQAMAGGQPNTRSTTPTFFDFDRDGDLDLFVAAHKNVFTTLSRMDHPMGRDLQGQISALTPISKRVANPECLFIGDPADGIPDTDISDCEPRGGPILLRNQLKETGDLKFMDATDLLRHPRSTGLDGRPRIDSMMMFDAAATDFNADGYPDLIAANDMGEVVFFQNQGGTGFLLLNTEPDTILSPSRAPTDQFGRDLGAVGAWMAVATGDYNGDGRIDIFATNAGSPPIFGFIQTRHALYINLGETDGVTRFIDVASQVDGDTPPDQIGIPPESPSLATPAHDDDSQFADGSPVDVGSDAIAGRGQFSFAAQALDFDNDRDLDIIHHGNLFGSGVGTRMADNGLEETFPPFSESELINSFRVTTKGVLFRNKGKTRKISFAGVEKAVRVPKMKNLTETLAGREKTGLDSPFDGRGMATGDLNNDGRLDVILANVSGLAANRFAPDAALVGGSEETAAYEGGLVVYQNQSRSRGKLVVLRLEGNRSNRSGIGARVTVTGGGRRIVRELLSNVGHAGNAGLELAIGVGDRDRVGITIEWPSGVRQKLRGLRLDHRARNCFYVTETDGAPASARKNLDSGVLRRCEDMD